jgi:hypothetical protein
LVLTSIRYSFSKRFAVPVEEAFRWSIDYEPNDFTLMGIEGKRKVNKLTDDTFILEDSRKAKEGEGWVQRLRLIRINHERRSFSNTHIGGPTPHSQFWYEFFPEEDGGSRLDFTGLFLLPSTKKLSKEEVAKIAEDERKADSQIWKNLAKAMEADLREGGSAAPSSASPPPSGASPSSSSPRPRSRQRPKAGEQASKEVQKERSRRRSLAPALPAQDPFFLRRLVQASRATSSCLTLSLMAGSVNSPDASTLVLAFMIATWGRLTGYMLRKMNMCLRCSCALAPPVPPPALIIATGLSSKELCPLGLDAQSIAFLRTPGTE